MAIRGNKKSDANSFRVIERIMDKPSKAYKMPSLKEQIEAAEKEEHEAYMKRVAEKENAVEELRYTKDNKNWTINDNHTKVEPVSVTHYNKKRKRK